METRTIQTSLGPIPLTGNFGDKLKVLAINGAFAKAEDMSRLPLILAPDYDGVVAFLPGDLTPALSEVSISAFIRAFQEVVEAIGPTVVFGHSAGGVVGLGIRSPLVRAVIAIDPPLLTSKLWPVIPDLRAALATRHGPFIRAVFGVTEDGCEERDYRPVLDGLEAPTHVVVGSDPLFPERPLERQPSFVDAPERQLYRSHPRVKLHVARDSGHNVFRQAVAGLLSLLKQVCRDAATAEAALRDTGRG